MQAVSVSCFRLWVDISETMVYAVLYMTSLFCNLIYHSLEVACYRNSVFHIGGQRCVPPDLTSTEDLQTPALTYLLRMYTIGVMERVLQGLSETTGVLKGALR